MIRRRGFSLLETLVAAGIAAVLGLIVFTLVRTVRDVREAQRGADEGPAAVAAAAEWLARDLVRAFPADEGAWKIRLGPTNVAGVASSALLLAVHAPAPGEDDLDLAEPLLVEWRVAPDRDGVPALARVTRALAGPRAGEPAQTNRLVTPVSVFELRFFDGTETVPSWLPPERNDLPVSAEFKIGQPGGVAVEGKAALPAGTEIQPIRGAAQAP